MPCRFILTTGPRKGQVCDKGCGSNDQCSRHRKIVEIRENKKEKVDLDLKEFIGNQAPVDLGGDRLRKSVFGLTLNSQRTVESLDETDRAKIQKIMKYLFDPDIGAILDFVDCRDGASCFRENPELLVENRWDYKYEIGTNQQRLHAHSLIELDHRTVVSLDISGLKALFREYFGWSWHINVTAKAQTDSASWAHYINKNIPVV